MYLGGMKSMAIKELLDRETALKEICSELNNSLKLKPTLIKIIRRLKDLTSIEAISIRLHEEGDYPYYVYDGFPKSFIKKESSLCAKDNYGRRIKDNDNNYLLECMCGNIIRGRTDPKLEFFTEGGSFWSNNTSKLLSTTTEDDRQSRTRNYCNSCGYESVALIPIKHKNEIIGLIQLNDFRTGLFTIELIEYIEMIGKQIGITIQTSIIYEQLLETYNEIKQLKRAFPRCFKCGKIRDDEGYWQEVEEYMKKIIKLDYSHGLCPTCYQELVAEKSLSKLKS